MLRENPFCKCPLAPPLLPLLHLPGESALPHCSPHCVQSEYLFCNTLMCITSSVVLNLIGAQSSASVVWSKWEIYKYPVAKTVRSFPGIFLPTAFWEFPPPPPPPALSQETCIHKCCPCSHPNISPSFYCCSQPVTGRKTFSHPVAWFNAYASLCTCSLDGGLTKSVTTILTEEKETGCQGRAEVQFFYMVLSSLAFSSEVAEEKHAKCYIGRS